MRWLVFIACLLAATMIGYSNVQTVEKPKLMWVDASADQPADTRVAFRGSFELEKDSEVEIRLLGASWFNAFLDGKYILEGPARFALTYPEYSTFKLNLKRGKHCLAVEVIHEGVATRIMEPQMPFLFAEIHAEKPVPVSWKASRIGGHSPKVRRINPQLGWIEWCDTRLVPDWKSLDHDDRHWAEPVAVTRNIGPLRPLSTAGTELVPLKFKSIASGELVETFGYEQDDPAARFFLRDLKPTDTPAQGVWRRYDLGKVGLWRPQFTLDLPAGAVVEFAYSETLVQGRVSPWITLSAGPSCSFDHYIAKGGKQTFQPLITRGGRYVEVHVLAPSSKVKFVDETFLLRRYSAPIVGKFESEDPLLNQIWKVGVDTLDSCLEDAVIDNPTRERGQWSGDLSSAGMEIAAMSMHDLRVFRRGLVHCAQSARSDGLVAGMCPGQQIFLSSYAAMWVGACVRYTELTGDFTLLEEMFDAAQKNIAAFESKRTAEGIPSSLAWAFIDWGYVASPGSSDIALNLLYLDALEQMSQWSRLIKKAGWQDYYQRIADKQRTLLTTYFEKTKKWEDIGYHRAALGLKLGFFEKDRKTECIQFIKAHMLRCFPNDLTAPRLSDPGVQETRLITPYFANFVMPLLMENGETDFVLDQYRKCWGWMLKDGQTTWMEVFDSRWSQCHQWSGSPTWQLSQSLLGLEPSFDRGENEFNFRFQRSSLNRASGWIPFRSQGNGVKVSWERTAKGIAYTLDPSAPMTLHFRAHNSRPIRISKKTTIEFAG